MVPLRLPEAPQLGDPAPDLPRPRNLDVFPGDPTLRKLLHSPSLDPAMMPEPPAPDSVGIALGMIARLMVLGCAAAAVALLMVGAIPLPFKSSPVSESTATAAKAWTSDADRPAKAGVRVGEGQRTANLESAAAPTSAPTWVVASTTVRAPQAVVPDPRMLEPDEVARLTRRGEDLLAQGDIAAARLMLVRAAEAQDARAAFALGATYDPAVLKQLGVVGFRPDVALARTWYEKAAQYGSSEAARRLPALPLM